MSKGKLTKFADMERYSNVFQYPYSVIDNVPFEMKGEWGRQYFKNDNPIVLELGCGKGEYTVGLAKLFPNIIKYFNIFTVQCQAFTISRIRKRLTRTYRISIISYLLSFDFK